jgi:Zn-dependent peptidase ImmA (M78 family)/DNA-binding XRE family transcriptional regulator
MAVSQELIGQRIAEARVRTGITQVQLAAALEMDRSVLAKIESGARPVKALELANLATALDSRIEWFVDEAPEAIVSRRNVQDPGAASPRIDFTVERIARSVEFAETQDEHFSLVSAPSLAMPQSQAEAEALASTARELMSVEGHAPLTHLDEKLPPVGLLAFSLDLGVESADAATVQLRNGAVSLVNGSLNVGRRRLALAHELGHFLVADEYTVDWRVAQNQNSDVRENLFDHFARALLLPGTEVEQRWHSYSAEAGSRTAAVKIASEYRVDMTTLARRLVDLKVIGWSDIPRLKAIRTTQADILEMNLVVGEELNPPHLPREYELSVVRLFRSETVSADRAIDLLLDTWEIEDLPSLPQRSHNEIWQFI